MSKPSRRAAAEFGERDSRSGRLLAVDIGRVRSAWQSATKARRIASPLETYGRSEAPDADYLSQDDRKRSAVGLIVGLTISPTATKSPKAPKQPIRSLAANRTGCRWPVTRPLHDIAGEDALWDAGLSHKKTQGIARSRRGSLILQGYMDGKPRDARRNASNLRFSGV